MIGNALESFLYKILLTLDAIVYNLITHVYNIFDTISKINLFSNDSYQQIVERIYIILGMVMMFVLAYALLRAVINPEDFAKGETSFPKLIQNIIVSLVIIVILPTVFAVATNIQNSIINNGTIPQIILGEDTDIEIENANPGRYMAQKTFRAFFYADESSSSYDELEILDEEVLGGKTFGAYKELSDEVVSGNINYMFIISTLAGAFILYVLLNFCFDLALRAIKLMFYQIIAPIPVVCRVIPFGSLKDVFNKWVKNTVSTFVDIFIRIMVMYFGVLLVQLVCEGLDNNMWGITGLNGFYTGLIKALLIMGIVMFIRQAPKLLGDIFGIDTGNMKLGLMDRLSQGGGLIAGAAITGGAGMIGRNLVNAGKNVKKAYKNGGLGSAIGASVKGIGSVAAGATSGFVRSGYNARGAKNFADTKGAITKGITTATKNRDARETYVASRGTGVSGIAGAMGNIAKIPVEHLKDTARNVGDWLGINSLEAYNAEKDFYGRIIKIDENSDSVAADLLGRDAIKSSVGIMKAVNSKFTMSYDAMQSRLKSLESDPEGFSKAFAAKDHKVYDFYGDEHIITDENKYAEYLSTMRIQMGKAERDTKKYLKRQGYKGKDGNSVINAEDTYFKLINADTSNVVINSQKIMETAGGPKLSLSNINTIVANAQSADVKDIVKNQRTVKDLFDNDIKIRSEDDYNNYLRNLNKQKENAEDKLKIFLHKQAKNEKIGINKINETLGVEVFNIDDSRLYANKDLLDTGELQRMAKLQSDQENVADLVAKNQNTIAGLNAAPSTDPNKKVSVVEGYLDMDDLTNNAKNRNIAINAEIEKLTREREARNPQNNDKK